MKCKFLGCSEKFAANEREAHIGKKKNLKNFNSKNFYIFILTLFYFFREMPFCSSDVPKFGIMWYNGERDH